LDSTAIAYWIIVAWMPIDENDELTAMQSTQFAKLQLMVQTHF